MEYLIVCLLCGLTADVKGSEDRMWGYWTPVWNLGAILYGCIFIFQSVAGWLS